MNPLFYKECIPKSRFITKILQLIDENPNSFKDWDCPNICSTVVCCFRNTNLFTRYVFYKVYT